MMNGIILISGIIILVINIIILMYVLELEKEKCGCSKHWMRDFIKYWTILMIVIGVLLLIIPTLMISCVLNNSICRALHSLYGIVGTVYMVVLIVYYFHLNRHTDCYCALDWKRHVLIWPIVLLGLAFVVGIGSAIFGKPINRIRNRKMSSSKSNKSNRK
jgi:hypothetical protein